MLCKSGHKNYTMNVKIDEIKIRGRISAKFGCVMTHTFGLITDGQPCFELEFSLPDDSAVNGFSFKSGSKSFAGKVTDLNTDTGGSFRLTQSGGKCRISCAGLPRGSDRSNRLTLEVTSAALMNLDAEYSEISIPLSTECDTFVRSESERQKTVSSDSSVSIDFLVDGDFVKRAVSSTHYITLDNCDDGLHIHAAAVTGDCFTLRIEYNNLNNCRKFQNTAYLSGGNGNDWTGVYLFSVDKSSGSVLTGSNLLYILDTAGLKSAAGHIAAECLQELIRRQDLYADCLILDIGGQLFSSKPLKRDEINFSQLSRWINDLENPTESAGLDITKIIKQFKHRSLPCEAVLVTCSGFEGNFTVPEGLSLSVLSVSENCFERELKELAYSSGGVYARMSKKEDYTRFIDGFSKRVGSGRLKNLRILEYASGTYFNLPDRISSYRLGDVIAYTFRSATEYPKQLFVEADGGFSDIVRFDSINIMPDGDENNAVFAGKVFSELYRYIACGDMAPESVAEFKSQAAKLSHELNVLCPETAYSAGFPDGVYGVSDKSYSTDLIIRLASKTSGLYADAVTVFGDSTIITLEIRSRLVYYGVRALLVLMRADYRFTVPYSAKSSDLETMYAAAAIYRAADCGYLPDKASYISVADKAVAAAGGKQRFENAAIDFGGTEILSLGDVKAVFDKNDVIEISRLILRLCRDSNLC